MATEKQLLANRANAKKSTGPSTEAGKGRSRVNSWKHGLTAKMLIIAGEGTDDFEGLRANLMHELDPQSALEFELVERLAGILWRLRRVPFDGHVEQQKAAGLSNPRVYHSADSNKSEIVVVFDTQDTKRAKEFAASTDLKEAMTKAGVVDQPTIYFLESID